MVERATKPAGRRLASSRWMLENTMTSLPGKTILLTGGSRGIGPVIAEALAARGAHLALAARSEGGLRNVAQSLSKYGIQTLIVPVDLTQPTQQQELISIV